MQNYFNIAFINIILIAVSVFLFGCARHTFHMLQLNSYYNMRYMKWYGQNFKKECKFLLIIPAFLSFNYFGMLIATLVLFGINAIFSPKTVEKKKFVVTPRVKRIYITMSVLIVLTFVIVNLLNIFAGSFATRIVLSVIMLMAAFVMPYPMLANLINKPVEALINRWYVNDAKKALAQNDRLIKIGITGSFGKTSTKYILSRILSEKYNVLMTPESYNTLMGVVKTIRMMLKNTDEIFVCEMGANQTRDIKDLCDLVRPQYGVLTSIGMQHLETFKTPENIVKTKYDLVNSLPSEGLAFLNFENEIIRNKKSPKPYISYGIENNQLDYWASDITYDSNGVEFVLNSKNGMNVKLVANLLGMHNVINIVAACAVSDKLNVSSDEIKSALKQLKPVPHRLELKKSDRNYTIIDDAFNSNPSGAKEAINVLGKFDGYKKILITPGFVELGEMEEKYHFELGKQAAKVCDFVILVGKKRCIPIEKGLLDLKFGQEKYYMAENLKDALAKLADIADNNSVVLFENDLPDNYES